MKYLVSQVENWREELAALPPPDPGRRKVGKEQAVIMMSKELQSAARQGYTAGELLEVLAAKGLKIHGDTLRDALRKVRRGVKTPPGRGRGQPDDSKGTPTGAKPETIGDSAEASSGGSEETSAEELQTVVGELGRPPHGGSAVGVTDSARNEEENVARIDGVNVIAAAGTEWNEGGKSEAVTPERVRGGAEISVVAAPEPARNEGPDGQTPARIASAPAAGISDRGAPTKRDVAGGKEEAASRPAAPPGRGTFTPRSDSDDI